MESFLPLNASPSRITAARNAFSLVNSTYANPRGFPVALSITTRALTSPRAGPGSFASPASPASSKNRSSSRSVHWKGTFRTNAVRESRSGKGSLYFAERASGSRGRRGALLSAELPGPPWRSSSVSAEAAAPGSFVFPPSSSSRDRSLVRVFFAAGPSPISAGPAAARPLLMPLMPLMPFST